MFPTHTANDLYGPVLPPVPDIKKIKQYLSFPLYCSTVDHRVFLAVFHAAVPIPETSNPWEAIYGNMESFAALQNQLRGKEKWNKGGVIKNGQAKILELCMITFLWPRKLRSLCSVQSSFFLRCLKFGDFFTFWECSWNIWSIFLFPWLFFSNRAVFGFAASVANDCVEPIYKSLWGDYHKRAMAEYTESSWLYVNSVRTLFSEKDVRIIKKADLMNLNIFNKKKQLNREWFHILFSAAKWPRYWAGHYCQSW